MSAIILAVSQVVLVVILIILILLQSPGSNSLSGFSSVQQGFNPRVSIRSSIDPLNKTIGIIALLFIINTILLSGLYSQELRAKSIAQKIELEEKKQKVAVPFENE